MERKINTQKSKEYYQALVKRDPEYDGVFYVGVMTTGIFCRSVCPARKPKFDHCLFFKTSQEALLASFRPCKRCSPLSLPDETPQVVQKLVEAVENEPDKRWKSADFAKLSTNAASASRYFKKRFGMTFVAYARARRMGRALGALKKDGRVIDTQHEIGYESASGFRDAFSKIMGAPPVASKEVSTLFMEWLDTPLGPMLAIADEQHLYLLEFVDRRGLEREIETLRKKKKCAIIPGCSFPIDSISRELKEYFDGTLKEFQTPVCWLGSEFQKAVWGYLETIPYGTTVSYREMADAIESPKAVRAVGSANGANQFAIIVPCHRVIGTDGKLTGYGGGLGRKQWLLEHERKYR